MLSTFLLIWALMNFALNTFFNKDKPINKLKYFDEDYIAHEKYINTKKNTFHIIKNLSFSKRIIQPLIQKLSNLNKKINNARFLTNGKKQKEKILKELPYALDLITVSIEAGLSFDGAMAKVVGNTNGALCDEFAKSLKEINMGIERKTALKNMSDRCNVPELSSFISSLIQADELGVSLSKVLRIESANLREHRKQAAREKAMKAPIKMLFPLVFFIFPSIFIIILGPTVIKILDMFLKP